jgi:hypothetical protein
MPIDRRIEKWLTSLNPREELVARMIKRGVTRSSTDKARIDELIELARINTTAKMARLMTDVRRAAETLEAQLAKTNEGHEPYPAPTQRRRKRRSS